LSHPPGQWTPKTDGAFDAAHDTVASPSCEWSGHGFAGMVFFGRPKGESP
jgi:hypothetical protein